MKQKLKQQKWYHFLLFFLIAAVLVFACRKIDKKPDTESRADIEYKFFNQNRSSEIIESKVVDYLKCKNDKHNFINKTVERIGYPAWNKMLRVGNESGANFRGNTTNDSVTVVFIPFVRESQNVVNACLQILMTPTDTSSKYICDWQYHDTSSTHLSARQQSLLLMQLNKNIFGNKLYKIIDTAAFGTGYLDKPIKYVKLRNSTQQIIGGKQTNTNKSSSLSLITFTFCSINLVQLDNGQLVGCPPDGPCNDQEEQYICTDYSFWADVYDGNNSGTGNSGGSGDSGGGGDDGVPPPCNGSGRLSNVINPCSPGWEPVEDVDVPSYDPCEDIQKRAKKIDTIYAKGKIDSLIGTIPNFATETKEKGFPTIQNFSIYPFPPRDTTFGNFHIHNTIYTGTDSNIHYNFTYNNLQVHVASTHTHPPKGYPAPSADDVYNLINDMLQDSYCQTFFVYASNGSKYALTINNYNQALAFWTTKSKYLNGAKWNEDSTVGKSFKEATKYFFDKYDGNPNQENLAYEMAMAAVLSKFNTGITLNKQDVSGNFKPIIVTQVTDPKKHKRTIYSQECL